MLNVSYGSVKVDSTAINADVKSQPELPLAGVEQALKNLTIQPRKEFGTSFSKVSLADINCEDLQRHATESVGASISRRSSYLTSSQTEDVSSNKFGSRNSFVSVRQTVPFQVLQKDVMNAVIHIFATSCEPLHYQPWKVNTNSCTGTGFIISERRIVTNYHVVQYCSVVQVKRRQLDKMFLAKRVAYSIETDLAILTVTDDKFWEKLVPLSLGELPTLQDPVTVMGYPLGEENICITAGVTSRIQMRSFSQTNSFLVVQIDAAINNGNSGGPALNKFNQVVGVAYEKFSSGDVDNVGYLISIDTLTRFLIDVKKNGYYTGSCISGFRFQELQNDDMRRYLKMKPEESGVLIVDVNDYESCEVLQKGDIVTAVDGVNISNSGSVMHYSGEWMPFHSIVVSKFVGDILHLSIIRKEKRIEVSYQVPNALGSDLVPLHRSETIPGYLIFAGFVFIVLTQEYLRSAFGSAFSVMAPNHLVNLWRHGSNDDIEEVVIIGNVLTSEINIDYLYAEDEQVISVNNTKIRSLKHLSDVLHDCEEEFLRFDLSNGMIVLDHQKAIAANNVILTQHNISSASRFEDENGDKKDSQKDSFIVP